MHLFVQNEQRSGFTLWQIISLQCENSQEEYADRLLWSNTHKFCIQSREAMWFEHNLEKCLYMEHYRKMREFASLWFVWAAATSTLNRPGHAKLWWFIQFLRVVSLRAFHHLCCPHPWEFSNWFKCSCPGIGLEWDKGTAGIEWYNYNSSTLCTFIAVFESLLPASLC